MTEAFTKQVARFTDGGVSPQLLRDFRIASSVLCRSLMAPPWGFSVDPRDVGSFHLMMAGDGWLEADGVAERVHLRPGDVVVLPRGTGHRVTDSPRSPAPRLMAILEERPVVDGELRLGADAAPSGELVCGTFTFEGGRPAWFERLPPVVASAREPANGNWRYALTLALRDEARAPTRRGAGIVRIGRVLAAVQNRPAERWTLPSLADAAAMSRSAFAERFRAVVGEPPGAYVTRVRLDRARHLLRATDATVADVAAGVGYGSEESLSRAFKARFGVAPSVMRRSS